MKTVLIYASFVVLTVCQAGLTQEPAPTRTAAFAANQLFAPDHLVDIQVELASEDWDQLREQTRSLSESLSKSLNDSPFTYFKGNVTVDGVRIEDVGIRKKGFLGSLSRSRPSLKIKFSEYKDQDPISGLDRLTLNNSKQDPSRLSQYLAYKLFNESGTIAPRCNFAKVTVNGKYLGIYSNVESVKPPFLRRFDEEIGALYEGTVTDFFPDLIDKFEFKNKEARSADLEPIVNLLQQEQLDVEALGQYLDIDAFLRFWAMESLIGFWDGYTYDQNNYFLYKHPRNSKLYFIPWGTDSAFTQTMPLPPYIIAIKSVHSQSILTNRLYRLPEIQDRYHATMLELLSEHWDEDKLLAEIDRVQEMLEPHLHSSNRRFAMSVRKVRYFVETRREVLQKEIDKWPIELAEGPRRPAYFKKIGTATASFTTQWYDKTPKSPEEKGQIEMELVLDGEPVTFQQLGVFCEPNKHEPADDDGTRPPTIVFSGLLEPRGKRLTIAMGLSTEAFHPSDEETVDVEGILIEGSPGMFFAKMLMGKGEMTWVKGQAKLGQAEMKQGATVQGEVDLTIAKLFGGKPVE